MKQRYDTSPLATSVRFGDVWHYRVHVLRGGAKRAKFRESARLWVFPLVYASTLFIAALAFGGPLDASTLGLAAGAALLHGALAFVLTLAVVLSAYQPWRDVVRMYRFAQANSLPFDSEPRITNLRESMLYASRRLDGRFLTQLSAVRFPSVANEPNMELTHARYHHPDVPFSHTTWVVLTVSLPRPMPHMVLDSIQNDYHWGVRRATNLIGVVGGERIHLEGDFDRYFRLHTLPGAEIDALQIFTPDFMATLIDGAPLFDAEVVGGKLFLYYRQKVTNYDAHKVLVRMLVAAQAVPVTAIKRSAAYAHMTPGLKDVRLSLSPNKGRQVGAIMLVLLAALLPLITLLVLNALDGFIVSPMFAFVVVIGWPLILIIAGLLRMRRS